MADTKDCKHRPLSVGDRVERVQGRSTGERGVMTKVHGSIAGDTLVDVALDAGTTISCYSRQLKVLDR